MSAIALTADVVAGKMPTVEDPRDRLISGMADRIQRAIALSGESENALSEKLGYARTQLNMTRRRLIENASVGVDIRIVVALARAAKVSVDWLATGVGPASESAGTPEDCARRAARALGYAPELIDFGVQESSVGDTARAIFFRIQSAEAVRPANRTEASPKPPDVVVGIAPKDESAPEGDNRKPAKRAAARAKDAGAK